MLFRNVIFFFSYFSASCQTAPIASDPSPLIGPAQTDFTFLFSDNDLIALIF